MGKSNPSGLYFWHPDGKGNLIADEGDNALTLSEYLLIPYMDAYEIFYNLQNWDYGNSINSGIQDIEGHMLTWGAEPPVSWFDQIFSLSGGNVLSSMFGGSYGPDRTTDVGNINNFDGKLYTNIDPLRTLLSFIGLGKISTGKYNPKTIYGTIVNYLNAINDGATIGEAIQNLPDINSSASQYGDTTLYEWRDMIYKSVST